MKRINFYLFVTMAMLMLSVNSAWAQYVKVTAPNGTVSWIEIEGTINGSNIEISTGGSNSAIDRNTTGSIDLNEVWSRSGGRGTHYQVTSIGFDAFRDCSGLTSITIPSSVTSIGNAAFYYCSGLTSITIPSSVTSIGETSFFACSGLTSIVVESDNSVYDSRNNCNAIIEKASNTLIAGCKNTKIPSSVTSIGYAAFYGCTGLTSIDIPSNVTSIDWYAFRGCSGLTSIVIPNSVTSIGYSAFLSCSGLTSIVIPSSVTSIGDYAFCYCSGLTSIVVEPGNTKYDSRNNCNAIIEKASNTLIAGCKNTKIPSSVTSIGYAAFYGCTGLTSIDIPSSVTSIGDCAFLDCIGLTSIDIPSSVTSIGSSAFSGCRGLTSIDIPSSVTSIGGSAFSGCRGLTSITCYITDVFETGKNAFRYCDNATLYVPYGLVSTYQSTADWNSIKKIEEIPGIALAMSCNNKGKVTVNGGIQFTNDMGEVSVFDGTENIFVFTPEENCQLEQVLIDGLDVTLSVKNNQLTTKVHEGSKMIVIFDKKGFDVNGDGQLNISDVVALVNLILGQ